MDFDEERFSSSDEREVVGESKGERGEGTKGLIPAKMIDDERSSSLLTEGGGEMKIPGGSYLMISKNISGQIGYFIVPAHINKPFLNVHI